MDAAAHEVSCQVGDITTRRSPDDLPELRERMGQAFSRAPQIAAGRA